jgi:hypothetical protein
MLVLLVLILGGVYFLFFNITILLIVVALIFFISSFVTIYKENNLPKLLIVTISGIILFVGTYQLAYQYLDWLSIKKYEGLSEVDSKGTPLIQNGDIIFQTSLSNQSKAIQLATNSKYSHVGIIYKNDDQFFVYEAIQPVKLTLLTEWVNRGENGHYVIKRLKNAKEVLSLKILTKMRTIGEKYIGKNYDIYFEWSDEKIYCSELVWKIYKEAANIEIGELEELSDFDLSSKIVQQKMKERYGDNIPMKEKVISPASMFDSDKLITIIEK